MPKMTLDVSLREIQKLVFQLPPRAFLDLAVSVEERAETLALMRLAESGFADWNAKEESLYDARPASR